jgi:prepilin peptidase CpaA
MTSIGPAAIVVTVLFTAACVVVDVRRRRIPNLLTFPTMIIGIALSAASAGPLGVARSVAGVLVALLVLGGPFALGGVGGGDVKMMGAVGALLGPRVVLPSLVIGMVAGGVVMLVHLARQGRLGEKLKSTAAMMAGALSTASLGPLREVAAGPNAVALPYSVPLAVGTFAAIALSAMSRA